MTMPVARDSKPMIYSVEMPNYLNCSFNFYYSLYGMVIMYIYQFPINYGYLIKKRALFYKGEKKVTHRKEKTN